MRQRFFGVFILDTWLCCVAVDASCCALFGRDETEDFTFSESAVEALLKKWQEHLSGEGFREFGVLGRSSPFREADP